MTIYDRICSGLDSIYHEPFETMERLNEKFSLSWYPSSGKCFQDLLAWRRIRPFDFPEPDLMIHTDSWQNISFEEGAGQSSSVYNSGKYRIQSKSL